MSKILEIGKEKVFVIAYELMNGGQLKVPKDGYPPEEAFEILKQILHAYKELYKRGMTHRDLKPQNFLIKTEGNQKVMKISDFGAATEKTDKKKENIFTFNYASPEQIRMK